jgi:hypothetical protein
MATRTKVAASCDSGAIISAFAPLPPSVWRRRRATRLPFPLDDPACHVFARGRHGLWQGVRALGMRDGDEVLVPAYHHGSEIEALARAGLVCRFYGARATLAPDERELDALRSPRTRALHLIHYLGSPQDAARWRRWCDAHGLFLIEDAAQACLAAIDGRPVGSFGDLALTCLYKTFGLPDGAAVVCRAPLPGVGGRPRLGLRGLAAEHVLWLATRSAALGRLVRRLRPPGPRAADDDFSLGDDPRLPPSRTTGWAIRYVVDARAAEIRRGHYARLAAALGARVPADFVSLPPGASPLALPIFSADKPRLLARLAALGIRALALWTRPHPALPVARFPYAARLRAELVGLPVHQELRPGDVERMISAVEDAEPRARASA